jgi:alkylhydroperoxidase family enzyme
MARLPAQPQRDEIPEEERAAYDRVVASRRAWLGAPEGRADPFYGALLNSPPLANQLNDLTRYLIAGDARGSYTHAEREWIDLVLGCEFGWRTGLVTHMPFAVAAGVRPEGIQALIADRRDDLEPDERQLVDFVSDVVHDRVTDETYARLAERLGTRGAVEYTILICRLIMTQKLMTALGAEDRSASVTDADIAELAESFVRGTAKAPEMRERFAAYAQEPNVG